VSSAATVQLSETREHQVEPFYVPTFRVEIAPPAAQPGAFAPVGDVTRVTYKDQVNQIDSFEIGLSSYTWGSTEVRYAERLPSAGAGDPDTSPLSIMPGSWARLWMGYETAMGVFPMLTGRVTGVTPMFGGDGGVTMTVRALSSLDALRVPPRQPVVWRSESAGGLIKDSEIARRIGARYTPPVEVIIPQGLDPLESGESTVTQANQTDIGFLVERAKRRGYIVAFRENLPPRPAGATGPRSTAGTPLKFLYFGPSDLLQRTELERLGDRAERFELAWGSSLIDFKPTVNVSSNLWSEVSVQLWNRRTKTGRKVSRTLEQLWGEEHGLNADLAPLLRPLMSTAMGFKKVDDIPVRTEDQARDLARNTLRENFLGLVTAEGTTVGHPEIRACSRVELKGVGVLSGAYFVTQTTHTIDDGGYRTQFSARREETS
jgi:uncharacterized protein